MKLSTKYGNKTIEFEVSYRNRRTLAIQIEPLDKILVLSPTNLSEEIIKEKVKSKGKWIIKKLLDFKDMGFVPYNREFVNGESFMHLGRNYSLQIIMCEDLIRPKIKLSDNKFQITTPTKDQNILRKAMENGIGGKLKK